MQKIDSNKISSSGRFASIVGIIVNILLSVCKIVVGSIFGLISVVADGLNNITDSASSIVSLVSFKLSSKPADKEHPFGHERIEYICSLSVAFLVLLIAFNTLKESIGKIISPNQIVFNYWIIIVLIFSIIVKFGLFIFYKIISKRINSLILSATAIDSLTDCISTSVTLISFIVSTSCGYNIDGYAGIIVAIFIAWSAIGLLKGIFSNLIGKAPDNTMLCEIKEKVLSYTGVLSIHDLSVYSYGPNKYFASVHIEVPASVDVLISHELIDNIERDFLENTNIVLTAHLDPVETENPQVNELKLLMENIIHDIDKNFSVHDFRIVRGEKHTNLLFDIAIPYETVLSKDEIRKKIELSVAQIDPSYKLIITIEYCI